jgi:hypothetical protein
MKSFFEVLKEIWSPELGSIWKIRNSDWCELGRGFAKTNAPDAYHPGLVVRIHPDGHTLSVAPGTSKRNNHKCTLKIDSKSKTGATHFLLMFAMPYTKNKLELSLQGIGGRRQLSDQELEMLEEKRTACLPVYYQPASS